MAFKGYLALDGNEIGNIERFTAYVQDRSWFRPTYRSDGLGYALSQTYTDPATDAAPWWDPDVASSADFWGFCPVDITGLEDGSSEISTVESTSAGGIPGLVRLATKEVNVSGIMAGASEAAVEYGLIWLRRALLAGLCSPLDARKQALGTDLTYFGYEPISSADALIAEVSAQQSLNASQRTFRKVGISVSPRVMSQRSLACGDQITQVQFTLRIGDPYVYSNLTRVLTGLFDVPVWGTEVTEGSIATGTFDEAVCGDPSWAPLYDPECSMVITPPAAPNIPLACWTPPAEDSTHNRTTVTIPAQNFDKFTEAMPTITIQNDVGNIRDLRIRLYPDPDGLLDINASPCGFISDMVLTFMPVGTLVIDASREQVHITTEGGHTRRADSLLVGTDLRPIEWPVLDCGVQYLMTVDTLGSDAPVPMHLDLTARAV
jgi:hypothetical protein